MVKYDPAYGTALDHIDTSALSESVNGVKLQVHNSYAFITIRINGDDEKAVSAMKNLGLRLPESLSMSGSIKSALLLWISPDEYLLLVKRRNQYNWLEKLTKTLQRRNTAVVDTSGNYTLLELRGDKLTDALSKVINYDIRYNLPKRKVVSTVAGTAPVILLKNDMQSIHMLVRFSFSAYLYKLLEHASIEYLS